MKQHIFYTLLFFVLTIFAVPSSAFAYKGPMVPQMSPPPPPPPTNLAITGVTSTTISLSWSAPGAPFYQLLVVDLTGSITYPVIFGTGASATVTGLQPGHLHRIYVSVAYLSGGEYSTSSSVDAVTGYIVVEIIAGLSAPCTPFKQLPNGANLDFCVEKSPTSPVYGKAFIGEITYQNSTFKFAIAYTHDASGGKLHIGSVPGQPVSSFGFERINSGLVRCYYAGSPLFDASPTGFSPTTVFANGNLTFSPTFWNNQGTFTYCGSCSGNPNKNNQSVLAAIDNRNSSTKEDDADPALKAPVSASPNPFRESIAIQYTLTAPGSAGVWLYNAFGHLVQTVQPATSLPAGEYTAIVNGAGLPRGSYFAVVQQGEHRQVIPLAKQD